MPIKAVVMMKADESVKEKIFLAIQQAISKDKRVELVPTKDGLRVIAIDRKEIKVNTKAPC